MEKRKETISRQEAAKVATPQTKGETPFSAEAEEAYRRCEGCAFCAAFTEGMCNGER